MNTTFLWKAKPNIVILNVTTIRSKCIYKYNKHWKIIFSSHLKRLGNLFVIVFALCCKIKKNIITNTSESTTLGVMKLKRFDLNWDVHSIQELFLRRCLIDWMCFNDPFPHLGSSWLLIKKIKWLMVINTIGIKILYEHIMLAILELGLMKKYFHIIWNNNQWDSKAQNVIEIVMQWILKFVRL